MNKDYRILSSSPDNIKTWSSGTTQELLIYPPKAKYAKMNFHYRISLATVEDDTSIFTPLPGIQRTTMILEGELELTHKGKHSKKLSVLGQDSYDGGWNTSSVGRSTNFNLMTRGKTSGKLEGVSLEADEQIARPTSSHTIIYAHSGEVGVVAGKDAIVLKEGELIQLESATPLVIIKAIEASKVVITSIK